MICYWSAAATCCVDERSFWLRYLLFGVFFLFYAGVGEIVLFALSYLISYLLISTRGVKLSVRCGVIVRVPGRICDVDSLDGERVVVGRLSGRRGACALFAGNGRYTFSAANVSGGIVGLRKDNSCCAGAASGGRVDVGDVMSGTFIIFSSSLGGR